MDFAFGDSTLLISIFLFVVTLVVMFILRGVDKKNFRLPTIKKMAEKYESEVERSCQSYRQEAADVEDKINKKKTEVTSLIESVSSQIKDIATYSDDMAKLRSAMKTFHDAMDGLARISAEAEEKVEEVTQDTERLEDVRKEIEQFRREMAEAEERLSVHEKKVYELETSSLNKVESATATSKAMLEDAVISITNKHNEAIENSNVEIERISQQKINFVETSLESLRASIEKNLYNFEDRLETFKKVSEILTTGGKEVLSNICERSSEMLLASETVESLVQQRDKLEKQISDLAELKRLEEDNIAIARKEYERITESKKAVSESLSSFVAPQPESTPVITPSFESPKVEEPVSDDSAFSSSPTFEAPKNDDYMNGPSYSTFDSSSTVSSSPVTPVKEYYGKEETITFDN